MSKAITITVPNMDEAVKNCRAALDALGKNSGVALARAVNRSLEAVRAEATKIVRSAYTARREKLFDNIFVRRAGSQRPAGELELTGSKGISLIHFQARPALPDKRPKKGVSTKVRRDGPRRVRDVPGYTKPFILRKRQGGYGVFVREVGGGFRDWGGLQMLWGASPIQALQRREDQERLADRAAEVFPRRLEHEIDALLAGVSRGRK